MRPRTEIHETEIETRPKMCSRDHIGLGTLTSLLMTLVNTAYSGFS